MRVVGRDARVCVCVCVCVWGGDVDWLAHGQDRGGGWGGVCVCGVCVCVGGEGGGRLVALCPAKHNIPPSPPPPPPPHGSAFRVAMCQGKEGSIGLRSEREPTSVTTALTLPHFPASFFLSRTDGPPRPKVPNRTCHIMSLRIASTHQHPMRMCTRYSTSHGACGLEQRWRNARETEPK